MKMICLNTHDIYRIFMVISKNGKENYISEYCGVSIDEYSENNNITHIFRLSYTNSLDIYKTIFPIQSQESYSIYPISLPFDTTCIINQFLRKM